MSHKKKAKDFSILVDFLVESFNTGDYINPAFGNRSGELHRRFKGRYFDSDFIKEIFELKRDVGIVDPLFIKEVRDIADKIVEKEVEAIRVISEIERELLQAEGVLIKAEADIAVQEACIRAMDKMDYELSKMRQRLINKASVTQPKTVGGDEVSQTRAIAQSIQSEMHQDFRSAVTIPSAERFQTCRRHMNRVRDIIKTLVYEP